MGKHIIQIPSVDGCLYLYDADKKTLRQVRDMEKEDDIPADVKETLRIVNLRVETGRA
jgi:hypothetical protein